MPQPFEAFRRRKLAEVNAAYAEYLAKGFPTAPFEGEPEPETLQCRHDTDRTNWISLQIACFATRDAGLEGELIPAPGIRCTSNRMYRITYGDALARLWVLFDQANAAQANFWRLKDAVRDCPTRQALNDIDLSEGWP
ncbi:hypothetical protein DJ018_13350 [Phenylobacterium deserti]|uniref:DUF4376 domain-containing protein n=2 Tax=Phenylobacterium deserti TaxID=1914756 RepID=A0A328AD41_9CAUL|nr:hypothetical protein DJ018_13350 [Phenylobacterium deserti]